MKKRGREEGTSERVKWEKENNLGQGADEEKMQKSNDRLKRNKERIREQREREI